MPDDSPSNDLVIRVRRRSDGEDSDDQIMVELLRETGSVIQQATFVGRMMMSLYGHSAIVVNECRIDFSGGQLVVTDLRWERRHDR